VHPIELVTDIAPGVAGTVLDDADEQQPEPAELDVGTDPVLAVMEHRPEPQRSFHVAPAPEGRKFTITEGRCTSNWAGSPSSEQRCAGSSSGLEASVRSFRVLVVLVALRERECGTEEAEGPLLCQGARLGEDDGHGGIADQDSREQLGDEARGDMLELEDGRVVVLDDDRCPGKAGELGEHVGEGAVDERAGQVREALPLDARDHAVAECDAVVRIPDESVHPFRSIPYTCFGVFVHLVKGLSQPLA